MKLAMTLSLALFASPALAADGSVRLAWNACPGNPSGVSGVMFDCDPLSSLQYRLFATFTPSDPVSGVVAMDGVVDFMMRDVPVLPRFWHFEPGSCNQSGLSLLDGPPLAGCSGARTDLCGAGGAACDGEMVAYLVGSAHGLPPHRAKLVFTLARPSGSPVSLPAALQQYGFELAFTMQSANPSQCAGCPEIVALTWLEATLLDTTGKPVGHLDSAAPGSDATAYANCAGCSVVKQRGTSWGTIKALYR